MDLHERNGQSVAPVCNRRRAFHDPDPAYAHGLLFAERLLGDARQGLDPQEADSRAGEDSRSEDELISGNSEPSLAQTGSTGFRGRVAARIHTVVARDRALLSANHASGWRAGLAAGFLVGDWLGLWHVVPFGRRTRPA